jgi:uncharacterized membrane-anchored protein
VILPPDHPQRRELNDEVHARPPQALTAPMAISFLALTTEPDGRQRQWAEVGRLAERFGAPPPTPAATHFSADFGSFRFKAERHTEFIRFKVIVPGTAADPFAEPAITRLPPDWLEGLGGRVMVAAHVALLPAADPLDPEALARAHFGGHVLVGSAIAEGAGVALTDLRIKADGFSRFLVYDRGLTPRQAGRMVQRLLEVETYRMMALLALPVARDLSPVITRDERELAQITAAMAGDDARDEPALLERLTRLEAEIDKLGADHDYRFSASAAYYGLVQRRIAELREERIAGLQTFAEFMERRLAPAMQTCRSTADRLESLAGRVSRATQLLATRVALTRERQNQAVLESMNRRAALQLRLQQTVEGLSVAAITYYIVGLIAYAAKGLTGAGLKVSPDLIVAASIPVVVLITALGVRRIRRHIAPR